MEVLKLIKNKKEDYKLKLIFHLLKGFDLYNYFNRDRDSEFYETKKSFFKLISEISELWPVLEQERLERICEMNDHKFSKWRKRGFGDYSRKCAVCSKYEVSEEMPEEFKLTHKKG